MSPPLPHAASDVIDRKDRRHIWQRLIQPPSFADAATDYVAARLAPLLFALLVLPTI